MQTRPGEREIQSPRTRSSRWLALLGLMSLHCLPETGPVNPEETSQIKQAVGPTCVIPDGGPACCVSKTIGDKTVYVHFTDPYDRCAEAGISDPPNDGNIVNELARLIENVPDGSAIRGNIFGIATNGPSGTLIASKLRGAELDGGVTVKVSVDDGTKDAAPEDMNSLTQKTYCPRNKGCIADVYGGGAHSKLFTFSRTRKPDQGAGSTLYNVWIGSANLTPWGDGLKGFNNAVTVYGDEGLYDGLRGYADRMYEAGGDAGVGRTADFFDESSSSGYYDASTATVYASPEQQTDFLLERLQEFTDGTACHIRIMQAGITDRRGAVVQQLLALRDTGSSCDFRVMTLHICRSQLKYLLDRGIVVKTAGELNEKPVAVHDKVILVAGQIGDSRIYRTFTGSHNLNLHSLRANDDLLVEFNETEPSHPLYDAFSAHFDDAFGTEAHLTPSVELAESDGETLDDSNDCSSCSVSTTINGKTVIAHFTNPYAPCSPGGPGKDRNIVDELGRLIDNVPSGSAIRGNIFRIMNHPASGQLIASELNAAQTRGATVRVSLDHGTEATAPDDINSLNYHKFCTSNTGCIADVTYGGADTKLFTFSKTKQPGATETTEHNVWMSSANLNSDADGLKGFNNAVTIYNDEALYNGLKGYANQMYAESPRHTDFYDSASGRGLYSSSAAVVYASPEQQTDLVVERLNNFAHSNNPGCRIRVMESEITDERSAVVQELLALKNAGTTADPCTLEVMVQHICDSQLDHFLSHGVTVKKPGMADGVSVGLHDRVILVEGLVEGLVGYTYYYRTFTGSHSINRHSLRSNDSLFARFSETASSHALYDGFVAHFKDAFDDARSISLGDGDGETLGENGGCVDSP